jgi:hypothetical protein
VKASLWALILSVFLGVTAKAQRPSFPTATNLVTPASQQHDPRVVPAADPDSQEFWPITFKGWIAVSQSVAVILASLVALYGINSWRREVIGKRRMELAEEVLALFYQAKDIIASIRFPAGYTSESSTRKAEPRETPDQKRICDDAFLTFERMSKQGEVFSRIQALRYRFVAHFGKDAVAPFDQLTSMLGELRLAARQWARLSQVDERTFSTPESLQGHRASIEKYDRILWGMENDDPLSLRLEKAIETIEQICRPHIF